MAAEIESLLEYTVNTGSSELIITEGAVPAIRLAGQVCAVPDAPVIPFGSLAEFLGSLEGESGSMIGGPWQGMRWRVRYFREALGNGAVFRPLLNECPDFASLGIPPVLENMLGFSSGLVLFAGPACSGKTTSATAYVGALCESKILRACFLDKAQELPVKQGSSLILEDSVGGVAEKVDQAIRSGVDLLWMGDFDSSILLPMLRAAEAGALVVCNVTAGNSAGALDALVAAAKPEDKALVRTMLSSALKAVVVQRLLPGAAEGSGAVAAWEVLFNSQNVAMCVRTGDHFKLPSVIAASASEGMMLMDDSLAELVRSGYVAQEVAAKYVANPARFA